MGIRFEWEGDAKPRLEPYILADLAATIVGEDEDLEGAVETLVFHVYLVSDDIHGPTVTVSGIEGRPGVLRASYTHDTKWVSMIGRD